MNGILKLVFPAFVILSLLQMAVVSPAGAEQKNPAPPVPIVKPAKMEKLRIEIDSRELSLQDALRHAYLDNPTLRAERARLKAIHERLPQAYAGWKPTVSAGTSITKSDIDGSNFGSASGSTAKDMELSLNQPLFRGGQTFSEAAAARYAIAAQRATLIAREQEVFLESTTAYMNVLQNQSLLLLSLKNKDVIARELEATQDRFDVGELTRTDVSQAKARLAEAESDLITAQGNLNASRAVFEELIGLRPTTLVYPEINIEMPATLDQVATSSEVTSPVVISAMNAHRAAEEDVDDVFGELLPEVGLFSSWNRTFDPSPGLIDEQTTKTFGISASIPLYQAGSVRSRVREAKHTANQRYLEILETRRGVRQQAIENWEDWRAALAEIKSRKAQVEASEIALEGVKYEAELGSRTVLDVLDANQELLDAEVALVTAERNEVVAKFALLSTLGLLLPQTLGFPDIALNYSENLEDVSRRIFDMGVDRVADLD